MRLTPDQSRLVEDHLHLADAYVAHYARKWRPDPATRDDLLQSVRMGLIRAAQTFRPGGCAFATHAFYWFAAARIQFRRTNTTVPHHSVDRPAATSGLDLKYGGTRPELVLPTPDFDYVDAGPLAERVFRELMASVPKTKRKDAEAKPRRDAEIFMRGTFDNEYGFAANHSAKEFGVTRGGFSFIKKRMAKVFERIAADIRNEAA